MPCARIIEKLFTIEQARAEGAGTLRPQEGSWEGPCGGLAISPPECWCQRVGSRGGGGAQQPADQEPVQLANPTLEDAQRSFYNARYEEAAALSLAVRAEAPEPLAAYELSTSALLFQLKAALGNPRDREKAFKAWSPCPDLLATFLDDTARGQALARERLQIRRGR